MTISVGKRKTSKVTWFFAVLAVAITLGGLAGVLLPVRTTSQVAKAAVELSGKTMGTSYSIKCWSDESTIKKDSLQADVDKLLREINQQMSTYLPNSELSRFNATPAGEWFDVSKATALVTQQALAFHRITDGASDITVGPLVKLWDFGPGHHSIGAKMKAPSAGLLESTKARTGGKHLEVRLDPPALRKAIDHLEVDLSSIAKGYAVDAVADWLNDCGFDNAMVEIGGEVRASGTRLDGKAWRIGTEIPDLRQRGIHRILSLKNQALATSGDYRNFRVFDGEKVSHIIDPKTGRPLPFRSWSVTVIVDSCMEADALATALLVMGEDRGYDWCVEHHVAALFLIRDGKEIIEKATPLFLAQHPAAESSSTEK